MAGGAGGVAFIGRRRSRSVPASACATPFSIDHFTVGIIKAPVMAAVIGIVACGRRACGAGASAEKSLGQTHTTSSVVKGIFLRHRDGWPCFCDLLRLDRNVTMAPENAKTQSSG